MPDSYTDQRLLHELFQRCEGLRELFVAYPERCKDLLDSTQTFGAEPATYAEEFYELLAHLQRLCLLPEDTCVTETQTTPKES